MITKFTDEDKLERLDRVEKLKTRLLKYIMFKKRTEKEIWQKFSEEDSELLKEVIEILKELGYIDDKNYIERFISESLSLKNLSIYELKYKLYSKGISKDLVEEYFEENIDNLLEYEKKSAENIINKKSKNMGIEDIKIYLRKKGYKEDTISEL